MGERAMHRPASPVPHHNRGRRKERSAFYEWLFKGYPLRQDFHNGKVDGRRMVDQERDTCGNFVNMAGGRPSDHQMIDRLVGITCAEVDEAMDLLENTRSLKGDELVAALKFKIFNREPRPDVDDATIWRRVERGADIIESMVKLKDVV